MHNLFEGTAKRVLKKIWLNESNPLLKSNDTSRIHSVIEQFKTPSSVGRLPRKIISGYSSFTADQWKSWTLWFSLLACHASLRKNDYECWQQFVLGCSILCSSVIAKNDLKVADEHLLKFCEKFQHLYGKKLVSPNMHYHMHLSKCIENYGPIQVFWLFSFERYNGILGSYHTNQCAIEIQVMRKFCRDMTIKTLAYSEPAVEMHKQLFCTVLDDKVTGSVQESLTANGCLSKLTLKTLPVIDLPNTIVESDSQYLFSECNMFLPPFVNSCFSSDEVRYLRQSYLAFLPMLNVLDVPVLHEKCNTIFFLG